MVLASLLVGAFSSISSHLCYIFFEFFNFLLLDTLGKIICTGSEDATLRIWNPKSGENIHVVQGM